MVALHNLKFNGLKYVIKNINYKASTFFVAQNSHGFFNPPRWEWSLWSCAWQSFASWVVGSEWWSSIALMLLHSATSCQSRRWKRRHKKKLKMIVTWSLQALFVCIYIYISYIQYNIHDKWKFIHVDVYVYVWLYVFFFIGPPTCLGLLWKP